MPNQTGRKIILHKHAFPAEENNTPDVFVVVTIVEVKKVHGDYDVDKEYDGYRAVDMDGNNYYCNWEYFPNTSTTPTWSWHRPLNGTYEETNHFESWYDVTQNILEPIMHRPKFVDQFPGIVHYCEKHKRITQIEDYFSKCFYCEIGDPPYENTNKKWNGWF